MWGGVKLISIDIYRKINDIVHRIDFFSIFATAKNKFSWVC